MPDYWESENGLNLNENDAMLDKNNDDLENYLSDLIIKNQVNKNLLF